MKNTAADPWSYPAREVVRRDVVYFYDLQSEYTTIEPDIAWDMFALPYWDYLTMRAPSDGYFLERGCLAIVFAGALAHDGNICQAFGPHQIEDCRAAVADAHYAEDTTERLRKVALTALDLAVADSATRDYDRLASMPEAEWVHASTVRAYFRSRHAVLLASAARSDDRSID